MSDIDRIIENYKKLSTDNLISLAKDPWSLRKEILPYLQAELKERNQQEEVVFLEDFLNNKIKKLNELSDEDLMLQIRDRLDSGEHIESIKMDLKENGIDFFELLEKETQWKKEIFDHILSLKESAYDDPQIDEEIENTYGVSADQTIALKSELKTKGKWNLIIGFSLIILTGSLTLAAIATNNRTYSGSYVLLGIGIWRVIAGFRQRK